MEFEARISHRAGKQGTFLRNSSYSNFYRLLLDYVECTRELDDSLGYAIQSVCIPAFRIRAWFAVVRDHCGNSRTDTYYADASTYPTAQGNLQFESVRYTNV